MLSNVNYNPDVLSCLANLSNDEVFTPPEIANKMLDTLPPELFRSKDTKFLDPFTKSGVFLREIAKRLIEGLAEEIPNLEERVQHIMQHQIYGIGITELTALLARRTLYCAKKTSEVYSVAQFFGKDEGNIHFSRVEHTWQNGRCEYCGASQDLYDRDGMMETHAYHFIHNENPYKNMKFDVIIGNPPYQISDGGGTGDSAKPIYQLFIQQAIKMQPHYLCMIVPSRWMKGGKGLDKFRDEMINDTRMKILFDFEYANDIFPGVHIDGGVCYFLWDKEHKSKVEYYYRNKEGEEIVSHRYLKTDFSDTVIRDYRQLSIVEKAYLKKEKMFNLIVSSRNPYGISSDFFNRPENYKQIIRRKEYQQGFCKIYGVKGNKGGAKRVFEYIDNNGIVRNRENLKKYKLFFSKAFTTTATVPPEIIIGKPETLCTETFLEIGGFMSKDECLNCLSYIKTKFFRALFFYNRHSLNISQDSFSLIPLQDFSKPWTDEELYQKYGLTEEEINYIESMIRPME
ncbi:Eco57I restriction-modification methylase domain-containing protein [Riemerella anatipestifer]|uniref:Eco57I restriction-modification methylase domain-containing protein n=1 Tax=Riemerella anatipestifer TaxID=34085 RepID=UPI0007EC6339|nr:Eco57I restriction-modification methylase domain-containing protein [Riemerella anatipestifer]MDD1547886.1 restriction endonuclease [Riemerella anatipestifer]MDR7831415.1 Eco57I restriction-modification methylase domain-containing protein [Riemerella anatipestifer]OBP63064.1 restriction endonuclease [Riemerella anatipestifer]QZO83202.1 Eco57I restriction-modification methylase domain-containing protein [Riemerella anatipestifer]WKV54053.1 Eco57I restriction-modification methylase domain-con